MHSPSRISQYIVVSILENNKEDPSLFENHEHVLCLMEKFLFIAAPVGIQDVFDANGDKTEVGIYQIVQSTDSLPVLHT